MNGANRQRGFVVIIVAILMTFIFTVMAGLAIDVSRAYVVKTELQSAVDACALAGARNLYPCSPYNGVAGTLPPAIPNWTSAVTTATGFVGNNTVDHRSLLAADVTPGYWNISTNTFRPTTAVPLTASDMPAVQVSASMSSAKGNWAVPAFFVRQWIPGGFQPAATATAAISWSLRQPVFPYVVSQCVIDDTLSGARANGIFELTGTYQGGPAGQWTTLTGSAAGGDNLLRNYIEYFMDPAQGSAPPSLPQGQSIYVRTGATSNVYTDTAALIAANKGRVLLPIVACPVAPGTSMPITGFAPVQLTSATGGSTPTISGYLYPPQLVK